jgi:molybdopterin-binding protein
LARVTRRSISELGLVPGREVFAIVKSVAIESATGKSPASRDDDVLDA